MVGPVSNIAAQLAEISNRPISRLGKAGNWRRVIASFSFILAISAVTAGPVVYILINSFNVAQGADPFQFGLSGWIDLFSSSRTWQSILYSFALTLRVPIGVILAFLAAWLLVRVEVPGRRFIEMMFWFAFFLPTIPVLTGWILLLDEDFGLINWLAMKAGLTDHPLFSIYSAAGIIWAHLTIHTVPIMVILISPALRMIDRSLDEAAIVAGGSSFYTLRRIILPLSIPALFVAGTASFIKALESFEIEQIIGVPAGIYVYANRIYDFVNGDPQRFPEAMALSALFLVLMLALSAFHQIYLRRGGRRQTFTGRHFRQRSAYPNWLKWTGCVALSVYVTITIVLPFLMLIAGSLMRLFGYIELEDAWTISHWVDVLGGSEFVRAAIGTTMLGLSTALPGAILFAGIAWLLVNSNVWGRGLISFLVWLPWAFPGLILGVALLDLSLNAPGFSRFHGTIIPLMFGLLIKELPIGVQMMRVSISQTSREMTDVAMVSGAGPLTIFRKITLPLISPALIAVFLLLFSAAVKDVSTILLIAPPDMQTLSILMFQYTSVSEFEKAAVIGTIVALVSLALSTIAYRVANSAGVMR